MDHEEKIVTLLIVNAIVFILYPVVPQGAFQMRELGIPGLCTPKSATANCYEYVHKVSNMCNEALQDAHEGRRTLIYENKDVRIERRYIRQAN